MQRFNMDQYAELRRANLYYPFASKQDWEVGLWLLRSSLSMAAINSFFSLQLVRRPCHSSLILYLETLFQVQQMPLSFRTTKQLRGLAEMLPPGPQWKCHPWTTTHPTKTPIKLFYRDAIECVESLFSSPLLADVIKLSPFRLFKTAERLTRLYGEWLSGNVAWGMQVGSPLEAPCIFSHQLAFRTRYHLALPS